MSTKTVVPSRTCGVRGSGGMASRRVRAPRISCRTPSPVAALML